MRVVPPIVCLCGSSRFYSQFRETTFKETIAGKIVLSICFPPHADARSSELPVTPKEQELLIELHKRKIDMADEVLVMNVDGYVGVRTAHEIEYAMEQGKPVRWFDPTKVPVLREVKAQQNKPGVPWKVEISNSLFRTIVADDQDHARELMEALFPGMKVKSVRGFWNSKDVKVYD